MSIKNLKNWAKDLFPLNRSLAGKYNRLTLIYINKNINRGFKIKKAKSGSKVFTWKIPKEYSTKIKYLNISLKIQDEERLINFLKDNLYE